MHQFLFWWNFIGDPGLSHPFHYGRFARSPGHCLADGGGRLAWPAMERLKNYRPVSRILSIHRGRTRSSFIFSAYPVPRASSPFPWKRERYYTRHFSLQGLPFRTVTGTERGLLPHIFNLIPITRDGNFLWHFLLPQFKMRQPRFHGVQCSLLSGLSFPFQWNGTMTRPVVLQS